MASSLTRISDLDLWLAHRTLPLLSTQRIGEEGRRGTGTACGSSPVFRAVRTGARPEPGEKFATFPSSDIAQFSRGPRSRLFQRLVFGSRLRFYPAAPSRP